jgi:hypothetical protein
MRRSGERQQEVACQSSARSSPASTSHAREPETSQLPSLLKAAPPAKVRLSSIWARRSAVTAFQTRAIPFVEVVTNLVPSGLQAIAARASSARIVTSLALVSTSHTSAVPSRVAAAIRAPSGLQATAATGAAPSASVKTSAPVSVSQTRAPRGPDAVTIRAPSGEKRAESAAPASSPSFRRSLPVAASQTQTPAALVVTTRVPSALHAAE